MKVPATEAEMSQSFRRALRSGMIHPGAVTNSVAELSAQDGIADYVLTPTNLVGQKLDWIFRLAQFVTTPAAASIVASLRTPEKKSVERIAGETGLSGKTVSSILARIVSKDGMANGSAQDGFRLRRAVRDYDIELWAYELKLKNWKRAMYQAIQYKTFAHRVLIVLPVEARHVVASKISLLKRYGVGLLILDSRTDSIELLVRPRRSRPRSLGHYLYALSVFARRGIPGHASYIGPAESPRLPERKALRPDAAKRLNRTVAVT